MDKKTIMDWRIITNKCPFASLAFIFVFRIRPEQARPVCSTQKCPLSRDIR